MPAFLDIFLHLDNVLGALISTFGSGIYVVLFLVIFAETGLVVTPFLPGDSLLFAVGAFAGAGMMRLDMALIVLWIAAVLGDSLNYAIGNRLGRSIEQRGTFLGLRLHPEYLAKTRIFFERYGSKTIIFARFIAIVRTVAPFVAGVGAMRYKTFIIFNLVGATLWVLSFVGAGYLFGNIPAVRDQFTLVIYVIIIISLLPAMRAGLSYLMRKKSQP